MTGRAIIVGSGVAGAAAAQILLERNLFEKVVMIEAGAAVKMAERRAWLDYLTRGVAPYDASVDQPGEFEADVKKFELRGSRLIAGGGSTVHWGGWCLRFKPEDFALGSSAGQAIDWPLSYNDLESFYASAETFLSVAGDSSDDDPPRFGRAYPLPAVPFAQKDGPVAKALKDLGISYSHLPIARNSNCVTTGTCKYCPVGGRYSATMTIDELAAKFPNSFELKLRTPVTRILMASKRRAYGIEYIDIRSGEVERLEAENVIVCAGAIESPKLLLLSADNQWWPRGLGNDTGHVGRHLVSHPLLQVKGWLGSNTSRMHQEIDFPTLGSRHFDSQAEQPNGKMYFFRDDRANALSIEKSIYGERWSKAQIDTALEGRVAFSLNAFVEEFESPTNRVTIAPGFTRFGLSRTAIAYETSEITIRAKQRHALTLEKILRHMGCRDIVSNLANPRADHSAGTCRMSSSAGEGVVDKNLRVHETDNVYVCSNAVMPNVAAVNPTLTLVALAIRFAQGMSA